VILRPNKELALIDFGLARFIDNDRYGKQSDYWYIGDFLIYLYYSAYKGTNRMARPWYKELDISYEEKKFLKKLMGIEGHYHSIEEIKIQFEKIKNMN
jgi:serine/threonine-protein kinase